MPRSAVSEIPQPNENYLVDDTTLERLWHELHLELNIKEDDQMDVLTWIVPDRMAQKNGVFYRQGEMAALMVISPNPNDPNKAQVRTFGMTPLKDYRAALAEYGHYANRPHPAKTILGHLLRSHAKAIGALTGLTEVDEETYDKNLAAARWVAEMMQGDRYEEGETMQ